MFLDFFKSLTSLSNSTKILEACDWDEERAQNLVLFCISALEEISQSNSNPVSFEDLKKSLGDYLTSTHTQSEINILLEVIKEEMTTVENNQTGEC